jgi:hypothetical protein
MVGISDKPLAEKLLVRPGDTIAPINAPRNYKALLGPLPEGAEVVARAPLAEGAALVHLFVGTKAELETQLPRAKQAMARTGSVWVSWQKKSSGHAGDVSRDVIRAIGEENGLKTVRAIALDDEWSALKLVSQ